MNAPPLILEPDADPKRVVVRGETVTLVVLAEDPDGDDIFFEWPDLADIDHTLDVFASGALWVARAEIYEPDLLVDTVVRAVITDGLPGHSSTARWRLERP